MGVLGYDHREFLESDEPGSMAESMPAGIEESGGKFVLRLFFEEPTTRTAKSN